MTKLILTLGLLLTINANAAIECQKDGRYWYPKNDKAVKLASMLGVKTCTGKRFEAMVKKIGETSNVVKSAKKASDADILKAFGK